MRKPINLTYDGAVLGLIRFTPFLTSTVPATLIYWSSQKYLGLPWYIAIIAALAVETLGVSSMALFQEISRHNARYSAPENKVSNLPLIFVYSTYVSIVVIVNILLDLPGASEGFKAVQFVAGRALLSLLSIPGAVLVATEYRLTSIRKEIKARYGKSKKAPQDIKGSNGNAATAVSIETQTRRIPVDYGKIGLRRHLSNAGKEKKK